MLNINDICEKYKKMEKEKVEETLEEKIYETNRNGDFYVELDEKLFNEMANSEFSEINSLLRIDECIKSYIEKLEESGYKVEAEKESLIFTYPYWDKKKYYISWGSISVKQYKGMKNKLKNQQRRINELCDENKKIMDRNLFQRILNKKI